MDTKTFPSHLTSPGVQLNPSLRNGRNMAHTCVNLPRAGRPHKLSDCTRNIGWRLHRNGLKTTRWMFGSSRVEAQTSIQNRICCWNCCWVVHAQSMWNLTELEQFCKEKLSKMAVFRCTWLRPIHTRCCNCGQRCTFLILTWSGWTFTQPFISHYIFLIKLLCRNLFSLWH